MLNTVLTVGGAGEGEAGEDPQEGHGSIVSGPSEPGALYSRERRDWTTGRDVLSETWEFGQVELTESFPPEEEHEGQRRVNDSNVFV